jgi:hypothetical protein
MKTKKSILCILLCVCICAPFLSMSNLSPIVKASDDSIVIDGVKDTKYTDDKKFTVDKMFNANGPNEAVTNTEGVKSEVWYSYDESYLYFYVKTTDAILTQPKSGAAFYDSDATCLFLDMNPSANKKYEGGTPDISVGTTGYDSSLVNLSTETMRDPANLKVFKDATTNTYGFEVRVPRVAGEKSFGLDLVVYNSNGSSTASAFTTAVTFENFQWWGDHAKSLQYVSLEFISIDGIKDTNYTDDKKFTVDKMFNQQAPNASMENTQGIKSEVWYNFDDNYIYFYVKTTAPVLMTAKSGGAWYDNDATCLFLDMNPSTGKKFEGATPDVSIATIGKNSSLTNLTDDSYYSKAENCTTFKDATTNTYGFEARVPRISGEKSFGLDLVVYNSDGNSAGSSFASAVTFENFQWWGDHSVSLQSVYFNSSDIPTPPVDNASIIVDGIKDAAYSRFEPVVVADAYNAADGQTPTDNTDNVTGKVWYNFDDDYLYFYVEVKDSQVHLWDSTKIADWTKLDAVAMWLDPDPTNYDPSGNFFVSAADSKYADVGFAVMGASQQIVNESKASVKRAGFVVPFKTSDGYGFEMKWERVKTEESFRFNLSIYNANNDDQTIGPAYIVAIGAAWWMRYDTMMEVFYDTTPPTESSNPTDISKPDDSSSNTVNSQEGTSNNSDGKNPDTSDHRLALLIVLFAGAGVSSLIIVKRKKIKS